MGKKILFVNSEIFPYLPETPISRIGRYLPQGIQERKKEIRSFMPRYGCINERKNQLHEVIRLSGMNIIINDVDRPLVIKVASISAARIQVYFIDNEDYFKRKELERDDNGVFFGDNAERAIFFARGVLETVKKLRWAPDVIHCHDTPEIFNEEFSRLVKFGDITESDVPFLSEPTGINLAKTAAQYSDGVIVAAENVDKGLVDYCKGLNLPVLDYDAKAVEDGSYIDAYNSFYDQF